MDQVTQQNAAMVEESNAASNALAQEAAKLRDLVSQFLLKDTAPAQAAVLRQVTNTMPSQQKYAPMRKAG
jgi:methyl-accepting chemotaxis protein